MVYILVIALIGLILVIGWLAICEDNMFNMGVSLIGCFVILGGALFGIRLPFRQPEVKEAEEIAIEYSELNEEAYDTKIQHGGITIDLYQKMEMHNEKVKNKNWKTFWCKASCYDDEGDYLINLDDYKVLDGDIPENNYVQPVRVVDEPTSTETTTSETITSTTSVESTSTETEETTLKKVIELNGQYYELVPIN